MMEKKFQKTQKRVLISLIINNKFAFAPFRLACTHSPASRIPFSSFFFFSSNLCTKTNFVSSTEKEKKKNQWLRRIRRRSTFAQMSERICAAVPPTTDQNPSRAL